MPLRKFSHRAARVCLFVYLALLVVSFFVEIPYGWTWVPLGLWVLLTLGVNRRPAGAHVRPATGPDAAAAAVAAPVTGRWRALNSPADKVPSHGTHALGQAYAIDIVAEPATGARPGFGWWPLARRNEDFPAYGTDVLAVADATVVSADDRQRDHLSRTSWPALVYFLVVEAVGRFLGGARRVVGNHVILDLGDGTYALYAHLKRGSLTVAKGDRVRAGQAFAQCGNSGNSTEPHVHFQLMDGADMNTANGTPFTWRGIGVPRNGETFEAAEAQVPAPGA
ncbi:M23 family metallopeptidase [Streptomyces monticola]|uniref:M23 family metallopeptidase n=1 Tax=Streptomyces monticola TaxID=2666263 RepID=A0ABW2JDE6_9ACTN